MLGWNDICEIGQSAHSVMRFAQEIAREVGEKKLLHAIEKCQLAVQLLVKLVDVQALTPDAAFDAARFFISKIPTPFVA